MDRYFRKNCRMNLKEIFGWLKESNRPKHIIVGTIIFAGWMALCMGMLNMDSIRSCITGVMTVLTSMCACEYKDRTNGGKWDWLDIVAGCIIPIIITILIFFT